jgi:hypothetical protein
MRKLLTSFYTAILVLFFQFSALAQNTMPDEPVQMADGLRSNGKIYVVVAVVVTILVGLFAYLISLDRKISRLEKP